MSTTARCQSCSMPLTQDPKGGGTEADGSLNRLYCSFCYLNGEFTGPQDMTAKEMQRFVRRKLREMGYNRLTAWLFSMEIPRLKRWKKA